MTVATTVSSINYTGNGVTTSFATTFPFDDPSYLLVTVAGVTKTRGVDYNVTGGGKGVPNGGNVVFGAAPAAAAAIIIKRTTPIVQTTSLRNAGDFSPEVHENEFDTVVEIEQELAARIQTLEGGSTNNATAGDGLVNVAGTWKVKADSSFGPANLTVSANGVAIVYNDVQANPAVGSEVFGHDAGASNFAAREDHTHAAQTAAAGIAQVGDAAALGAAATLARSDHKHNFPAPAAPPDVGRSSSAAGASGNFARQDHSHNVTSAGSTPLDIAAAGSAGTATGFSREDHTHNHANQAGGALHAVATTSTAGFMSAADKTKLDADGTALTQNTVTTTDATATVLITSGPIGAGQCVEIEVTATGLRNDSSAGAGYKTVGTFRNNGGTVTQVGTTTALVANADGATAVAFVINVNTVQFKVTGIAAQTWNWRASMKTVVAP